MKKLLAFTALLLTAALPYAFAQNSSAVGTWKYDAAQSDSGSMPKPKSMTLHIIKDTPQMLAWHVTEIVPDGKVVHESWSGPADGSMQTLKSTEGNGQASFQSNNGTRTAHWKLPNGATADSTITISDNGDTMTDHRTGTTKDGQPITETIVWHKVAHRKHKSM
ncbi:MAG TPA: hypothetical protein VGT04_13370 [Acidobacteriaceae bacterium]|nr:hypothetical protein [Acidobacteriaceae bacterium]